MSKKRKLPTRTELLRLLADFVKSKRKMYRCQARYEAVEPHCLFPPHTKVCIAWDAAIKHHADLSREIEEIGELAGKSKHRARGKTR